MRRLPRLAVALTLTSLLIACQSDQEKARAALQQAEETDDPAAAVTRLREAVALDPTLREAFVARATLELEQGDLASAAEAATRALELRGDDASMHLIVAKAALAEEQWAAAEVALLAARDADGSFTEALPLLVQAQAAQEKTDEALATFDQAEEAGVTARSAARMLSEQLLERAEARMDEWVAGSEGEGAEPTELSPEPPELAEDRRRIRELLALVDEDTALVARLDALDRRANATEIRREASNTGILGAMQGASIEGVFGPSALDRGSVSPFGARAVRGVELGVDDGGLGLEGSGRSVGAGRGVGGLSLGMNDSERAADAE